MISIYFGMPGCGKSCMMAKIARKALKKRKLFSLRFYGKKVKFRFFYRVYERVYSNYPIEGCYQVKKEDLGQYEIENALILWDEGQNDFDSRDYKNFAKQHTEFYAEHRHYDLDMIFFTQRYNDLDIKIRERAEHTYYVQTGKWLRFMSKATPIPAGVTIPEELGEIKQGHIKPGKIQAILSRKRIVRIFYYKYYNSYIRVRELKKKEFRKWDIYKDAINDY